MKKKLLSFAVVGTLALISSMNVSAASLIATEDMQNIEVVSTSVNTAMYGNPGEVSVQPRASYNVSSQVHKYHIVNKDTYYANGWVSLIDKESGKGVYHYSNAAMEDRSGWYTIVWAESGREYGTGTVYAKSPETVADVGAYIYYGTE